MNVHEAEETIRRAMIEHGTPNWVAHVSSVTRNLVPPARITELREKFARTSANRVDRRDTKHDKLDAYLRANPGALVTIAQLAEIAGCSREFIRQRALERPDVLRFEFRRATGNVYSIRNPIADRQQTSSANTEGE